jgi:hypothetical protein
LADDYIEVFVKWTPDASTDIARRWFERGGLTVTTMKSGAVLLGTRDQIAKAFSVSLEKVEPPINLPVPAELRDHVESVTISRPRSFHS